MIPEDNRSVAGGGVKRRDGPDKKVDLPKKGTILCRRVRLRHKRERSLLLRIRAFPFWGAVGPGVDSHLPDPILNDPFGGSEKLCRLGLVPPGFPERMGDQLALLCLDDDVQPSQFLSFRASQPELQRRGEVHRFDRVSGREQNGPFDTVFQFPDVARPVVGQQDL